LRSIVEAKAEGEIVSTSADSWTSLAGDSFLGVTHRWIEKEWRLHEVLGSFHKYSGSTKAILLAKQLPKLFKPFDTRHFTSDCESTLVKTGDSARTRDVDAHASARTRDVDAHACARTRDVHRLSLVLMKLFIIEDLSPVSAVRPSLLPLPLLLTLPLPPSPALSVSIPPHTPFGI
jgi:hypothetical protein